MTDIATKTANLLANDSRRLTKTGERYDVTRDEAWGRPQVDGVYTIKAGLLDGLLDKVAALNKKGTKLQAKGRERGDLAVDFTPIKVDVGRNVVRFDGYQGHGEAMRSKLVPCVEVTISGLAPQVAGWEFLATLEPTAAGTLLRVVPTAEVTEDEMRPYRKADLHCDHCGHNRRRKLVYVVREVETGRKQQVGSSCLGDYLGGKSAEEVARMAMCQAELAAAMGDEDEGFFGGYSEPVYSHEEYLAYVAASIRTSGWLSRTAARERDMGQQATADMALRFGVDPGTRFEWENRLQVEDADRVLAKQALAYTMDTLAGRDDLSDYEHNLRVALDLPGTAWKTAGIVASAVPYFTRALDREMKLRERDAERANAVNEYLGEPKKRLTLRVRVRRIHGFETMYGWKEIVIMADPEGRTIVWKSTANTMGEGHEYTIKGTVKAHESYRDTKQTILTRVKVVEQHKQADEAAQEGAA